MKKVLTCLTLVLIACVGAVGFVGCDNKDKTTHVGSLETLKTAIEQGGKITLDKDIASVNETIYVKKDTKLNLNGKKISGDLTNAEKPVMFFVNGAELEVDGNGSFEGNDCYIIATENKDSSTAKVMIKNGSFIAKNSATAVHAYSGEVKIIGGSYENTQEEGKYYGSKYLINRQDKEQGQSDWKSSIEITGGSFKGFNPADNGADGEHTNYVPSTYEATKGADNVWTVSKKK